MWVITKKVTYEGAEVSFEMSEIYKTWEFVNDAYDQTISSKIDEYKQARKKLTYVGEGTFYTPKGFKLEYSILLLSRVTPVKDL